MSASPTSKTSRHHILGSADTTNSSPVLTPTWGGRYVVSRRSRPNSRALDPCANHKIRRSRCTRQRHRPPAEDSSGPQAFPPAKSRSRPRRGACCFAGDELPGMPARLLRRRNPSRHGRWRIHFLGDQREVAPRARPSVTRAPRQRATASVRQATDFTGPLHGAGDLIVNAAASRHDVVRRTRWSG